MHPDRDLSRLTRFVPRVLLEWDLDAPGRHWQAIEGSLVFLDISGFTNLSERLARRGRIGTEELTEVLGTVFGSMLDISYERGGGLLKFGGDALLLLFVGDDHARQACGAAVEMRAALREATKIATSVGRVQLRMSVGVHSGTLQLFRVGSSHHELVIAGEGADVTARMEVLAGPGQVVVSTGTKRRLPHDATTELSDGGWLLRWRRAPLASGGLVERRSVSSEVVGMSMPALLRAELTEGTIESEHRLATVGFVKASGIDGLMASGPDAVAEALDEVVSKAQESSEAETVTFLASDIDEGGFKIILATGVPTSGVDDEGRMLRALDASSTHRCPSPLRAGVNRGHVYAGEIGTSHRSAYTVMGDTVNLAARLMAKAPYGAIYATPAVLEHAHTVFATELLEPFPVKGKADLIQAYAVGSEIGLRRATSDGDLPMTGREGERATLQSALSAATEGVGGCLTIVAEVGLGKTRLVTEALRNWRGAVVEVRGEPNGAASPFRALRDGLRASIGVTRGTPDDMARQLHEAVSRIAPELVAVLPLLGELVSIDIAATAGTATIDPAYRAERRAAALAALLDAMLPGPSVIVIEDAHWLDEASTELLTHLVAAAEDRPWLVLVTCRDEQAGFRPSSGTVLSLAPMNEADCRTLTQVATEAAPLWPHEVDTIIERAGGSPLFLSELLRVGRATGFTGALPDSLDSAMSFELDRLPPVPRRLVRTAAVLGRSFRVALLADLLAVDGIVLDEALGPDLDAILEREGPDRITFRHAMLRDVAYQGLPYRRRRELHLRAAAAIERAAQPHPEVVADALASHFALAGEHPQTWIYARLAGDRAKNVYANVEAATHFEQALTASRHVGAVGEGERADVWEALATVRDNAGQLDGADAAYRSALRLVPADSPRAGWLFERRAWVSQRRGDVPGAIRLVRRGLRLLDADPAIEARRCRARLFAREAVIRRQQGRSNDAMHLTRVAIDEAKASGDRMTLARSYLTWDWCLLELGRLDEAVHAWRRSRSTPPSASCVRERVL